MRVYHLTNAQHALSNIALRRIKISRIADLNDPFELAGADFGEFPRNYLKDELGKDKGILCFSKSWEDPLLWSHYADKHRGVCLGFDVQDDYLTPVIYTATFPKFERTDEGVNALLRRKFIGWEYENELRWFHMLDHNNAESGLYFYSFSPEFSLREVILGPRCEFPVKKIRELLSNYASKVSVIKSCISHTEFKVVKCLGLSLESIEEVMKGAS